jgi:hypothetical protein
MLLGIINVDFSGVNQLLIDNLHSSNTGENGSIIGQYISHL